MTETLTIEQQKTFILDFGLEFLMGDDALEFFDHIGFDLNAIGKNSDFEDVYLGHYRKKKGQYDVERAIDDLATWPPFAARILEIRKEMAEG